MADSIYRWRDEKGVLHFSGVPPVGVVAEEVRPGRISVVSMPPVRAPEPDCALAEGEPCEAVPAPGADSDAAPGPVAEPDEVAEPPDRERRRDSLSSRSQRLRDYDRRERIDEIERRRDATRGYRRDAPKTVSQQLRERAEARAP